MVLLLVLLLVSTASWTEGQSQTCYQRDLRVLMVRLNHLAVQSEEAENNLKLKLDETKLESLSLLESLNTTFRETNGQTDQTIADINDSIKSFKDSLTESGRSVNTSIENINLSVNALYTEIQGIAERKSAIHTTLNEIQGQMKDIEDEIDRIKGLSQCPDGWVSFNKSCYLFSILEKTFADAVKTCNDLSAHLVYVETAEENNFLKSFLRTLKDGHYWLGLTDEDQEGSWSLPGSNEKPSFFDWSPNEPNDDNNEDCGEFWFSVDFRWNDDQCSLKHFYVCERSKLSTK